MDLEEGNLQDLSGLPGKGPSLWRLWFLHNSTTVMLAKDVLGSLLHTRMKRRDTEGTQKAPEKSRHVMETQQQGPVPGSEDMAHVIPAWRFSTDWPIHPNTERWRPQKQIKSHKNESVGSSAVGRQASPVLYPNRKWGWQGDLSRESLVTPGLENTSPTFNKQQQLSKAGQQSRAASPSQTSWHPSRCLLHKRHCCFMRPSPNRSPRESYTCTLAKGLDFLLSSPLQP